MANVRGTPYLPDGFQPAGGGREECSSANGPLQSGECKKAAAESKRRGEGGDRKSGKMKLYSSGNCCYGGEEMKKKLLRVRHLHLQTGAFLIRNSIKEQQPFRPSVTVRILNNGMSLVHISFTVLCLIMVKVSGS